MTYILMCFSKNGNSYYSFDRINDLKMFVIKHSITDYAIFKYFDGSVKLLGKEK